MHSSPRGVGVVPEFACTDPLPSPTQQSTNVFLDEEYSTVQRIEGSDKPDRRIISSFLIIIRTTEFQTVTPLFLIRRRTRFWANGKGGGKIHFQGFARADKRELTRIQSEAGIWITGNTKRQWE
jgi:hypothetical protein